MLKEKIFFVISFGLISLFSPLQASQEDYFGTHIQDHNKILSINHQDNRLYTLWRAHIEGRNEIIRIYKKNLIDLSLPLNLSSAYGLLHMVRYFVESKGADTIDEALVVAAEENHFHIVKYFVKKGAKTLNEAMRVTDSFEIQEYLFMQGANLEDVYHAPLKFEKCGYGEIGKYTGAGSGFGR